MPVDIGTGTIDLEFDVSQVRREARDVERALDRTRIQTRVRLMVDRRAVGEVERAINRHRITADVHLSVDRGAVAAAERAINRHRLEANLHLDVDVEQTRRTLARATAPIEQGEAWDGFEREGLQSIRRIEREAVSASGRIQAALGGGGAGGGGGGLGATALLGGLGGIGALLGGQALGALSSGGIGGVLAGGRGGIREAFGDFLGSLRNAFTSTSDWSAEITNAREALQSARQSQGNIFQRFFRAFDQAAENAEGVFGLGRGPGGTAGDVRDFGPAWLYGPGGSDADEEAAAAQLRFARIQEQIVREAEGNLDQLQAQSNLFSQSHSQRERYIRALQETADGQDAIARDIAETETLRLYDDPGLFQERLRAEQGLLFEQTRAQVDLLRGNDDLSRDYQAALGNTVRFQEQQAQLTRRAVFRSRLRFGGPLERLGAVFGRVTEALTSFVARFAVVGAALVGLGVAIAAANAAIRRGAQLRATQVASASVAARRGVDFGDLTSGVRAGTGGTLSELRTYRTALDALRTEAPAIFNNIEQVTRDLRVVAAATGLTVEDATERFLSGIRKREPELLDELGITLRLQKAYDDYAASINVAASELTPYQQGQAIAAQGLLQLTRAAEDFNREAVLGTQSAVESVDRLGASWSNFVAAVGGGNTVISGTFATLNNFLSQALAGFGLIFGGTPEAAAAPEVDRGVIDALERNRILDERINLLTKVTQSGSLDIRQQRELLRLSRELTGTGGAQNLPLTPLGQRAREGFAASQQGLAGNIQNLAADRARARITAIQAPLNTLLDELEGGVAPTRLAAQAYANLTRNTEEANEAIELSAVVFGRTEEEVRAIIERFGPVGVARPGQPLGPGGVPGGGLQPIQIPLRPGAGGLPLDDVQVRDLSFQRESGRIAALRGPLDALLSSLEGGGRIARLTAEAYEDLTRNTAESEAAIRHSAAEFGLNEEEVRNLIAQYRELTDAQAAAQDPTRLAPELRQAIFETERGERLLTARAQVFADAINATTLQFRDSADVLNQEVRPLAEGLIPGAAAPEGQFQGDFDREVAAEQRALQARQQAALSADLSLSASDRFALAASNMGVNLETMQGTLNTFIEGLALQGQSLREVVQQVLTNLSRTLIQSSTQSFAERFLPFVSSAVGAAQGATGGGTGGGTRVTINVPPSPTGTTQEFTLP